MPLIDPIAEYSHATGNVITGGVINRGMGLGLPFWGRYFFADFGARRIWSIGLTINPISHEATAGPIIEHTAALGGSDTIGNVSAFGIAANCDVLFLNYFSRPTASHRQHRQPVRMSDFTGSVPCERRRRVHQRHVVHARSSIGRRRGAGRAHGERVHHRSAGSDWVCVGGGGWVPPGHPLAGRAAAQQSESANATCATNRWKHLHDSRSST